MEFELGPEYSNTKGLHRLVWGMIYSLVAAVAAKAAPKVGADPAQLGAAAAGGLAYGLNRIKFKTGWKWLP